MPLIQKRQRRIEHNFTIRLYYYVFICVAQLLHNIYYRPVNISILCLHQTYLPNLRRILDQFTAPFMHKSIQFGAICDAHCTHIISAGILPPHCSHVPTENSITNSTRSLSAYIRSSRQAFGPYRHQAIRPETE